jgi:hypothetical protein
VAALSYVNASRQDPHGEAGVVATYCDDLERVEAAQKKYRLVVDQ